MLSKTIYQARLAKDPTTTVLSGGSTVTNLVIAVERNYRSKGEEKPKADFFNCRAWGRTGELIAKHFKKGNMILLEGHNENDNYEKNGETVYRDVFIVENFSFSGERLEQNIENLN